MEEDNLTEPYVDLTYEEEQKIDDDLDYALAYCLQTDFDEDFTSDNPSSKQEKISLEDDSVQILNNTTSKQSLNNEKNKRKIINMKEKGDFDYMLALQLQKQYAEESLPGVSSSEPKLQNWNERRSESKKELDADCIFALQLQNEFAQGNGMNSSLHDISSGKPTHLNQKAHPSKQKHGKVPSSIVDPEWEVLDPIPDIHSLFLQFNHDFFWGKLEGVEVRWSSRMTLCAGICCYEGRGGLCSVRLSQPLLKYRPRRDLVETLLHEMIHAYLFVTHNNKDHDAHGPEFLKHMKRINQQTGTRISVYHSFHDEVDLHRKHWWKCNGSCQYRSPFFGLVKRAMNRAPSPRDPWWANHQATCGGTFIKIKEPENSAQKNLKRKNDRVTDAKCDSSDIRNFFQGNSFVNKENQSQSGNSARQPGIPNIYTVSSPEKCDSKKNTPNFVPFCGKGHILGSSASENKSTGPGFRTFTNFPSKHTENRSVNVSPVDKNSPSQKKVGSLKSLNPVQRTPPLHGFTKNKHLGSLGSGSSKQGGAFGTSVKFSSAGGSRTIVVPKNPKISQTRRVENQSNLPAVPFKGESIILGSGSATPKGKEAVFSGNVVMPSTSEIKVSRSRDSFDGIFPKVAKNESNKYAKTKSPTMRKEISSTQNKINFPPSSLKGENCDTIKSESCSAVNADVLLPVKCPVCGSMLKSSAINAHLDICLKDFN